jgi:hypothetical protein
LDGRVAYQSQFSDRINPAPLGKAKIKTRLVGDLDPNEWDLPPIGNGEHAGGNVEIERSRSSQIDNGMTQ